MTDDIVRVLLIDDDEGDAFLTRELFGDATEATGRRYRVDWVDSYEEGLEAAARCLHDIALVDFRLQPGSGLDLIREARAAGCRAPFILMTGMGGQEIDEQATEVGAADYLSKNHTDAALLERTVRYALRHAATLEALAERTGELQRSNAELEQFARAVSHDLRQPLHAIAGYTELLAIRYAKTDPDSRQMLERIVAGVDRMNQLIEDLLELSRIGAGRDSVTDVDCQQLLDALVEELQPRIEETGARIESDPLPVVHGRSPHLEQLLRNLLGNALKFVGDQPPRIRVRCAQDSDGWQLSVSDSGIGVPAEQRERIFEPFARGVHTREYEGTGVGLALCAKIVEQHGGRIWVEESSTGGACFRFTLPGQDDDHRPTPRPT
jgi:signal transduction histidine kinase